MIKKMSKGDEGFTRRGLQTSFEFFPPKTAAMALSLWEAFHALASLEPIFVSVTYGAGGATRHRTHEIVADIRAQTSIEPAAHLTCVGATRDEIHEIATGYLRSGVHHIVALRGDPPHGHSVFEPYKSGYSNSVELIRGLRGIADFEITAAAYPEPHPDSRGAQSDMDYIKEKCDAGAARFITQFFFDNDCFYRFYNSVQSSGVIAPIIPGILPITNFEQIARFSLKCGATIPKSVAERFDKFSNKPGEMRKVAVEIAAEQCLQLISFGVNQFHFYTLNRADLVLEVCALLGVKAMRVLHPKVGVSL